VIGTIVIYLTTIETILRSWSKIPHAGVGHRFRYRGKADIAHLGGHVAV